MATNLYGWFAGYRDRVWTNWYRRPLGSGVLTLAYMRERLNAHNLGTSYPAGTLVGFQPPGQKPPPGVTHFRTADGSWNNLADPEGGRRRYALPAQRRALSHPPRDRRATAHAEPARDQPPAAERARADSDGRPEMTEVPFLNLLAASWIQFMNGDWINHGEILFEDVIEVPLPEDDPARSRYRQTKMFIGKTQPDPTRIGDREPAATVRSTRSRTGGTARRSTAATRPRRTACAAPGSARCGKRRRHAAGGRHGRGGHGLQAQLVGGSFDAAHPFRARAQRHLRHVARGLPRAGTTTASSMSRGSSTPR